MSVADECRALGLRIGDTIFGREEGGRGYWHEARLTLLWLGKQEAMWSVQTRSSERREWSEPEEAGDWMLGCRDWRKVPAPVAAIDTSRRHVENAGADRHAAGVADAPAPAWERRQGMRCRDGWTWSSWQPCTDAEALRVTGLQSWQVRQTGACAACGGTGRVPNGVSASDHPPK
jgi:hypothetical protein